MILQAIPNECVRFGGHVDIQVSYKILQLEVLFSQFCTIHLTFNRGCLKVILKIKTPLKSKGLNELE